MANTHPEISVVSSTDGLGIVLVIANPDLNHVTVFEPHPHTSVHLFDSNGRAWPMHYGVFAATPRWRVTVPPNEVRQRIVTLPRFYLDAQGEFTAECVIRYQASNRDEQLTVRGLVYLTLPTVNDYYSEAGVYTRLQVEAYKKAGFLYPLLDDLNSASPLNR